MFMTSGCSRPSQITVTGFRELQSETQTGISDYRESDLNPDGASSVSEKNTIAVYVCGAVQDPGVYYLPDGSRICDALSEAGGFSYEADREWLNQAQTLSDGEMLVVYTMQETAQMREQGIARGTSVNGTGSDAGNASGLSGGQSAAESGTSGSGLINLNTASKEQLMTLPGIGEAKADAIIRYRTETGLFASTEDVMNISGIKNSIYEKIRDRVTV